MSKTQWWYAEGDERLGPIGESELREKLAAGKLPASSLVWREGLEDWVSAFDAGLTGGSEAIEPDEIVGGAPPAFDHTIDTKPHPWRRWLARWLDMVILSFITGLIGFRAVFFVLLLVWIPVEAWLLSSWGYTPGKWLTGTRIRDVTGGHLSFDKAMHRAFLVWFRGLGLGIPLVWLFTMPYAYFKLKYTGMTSWDRELRVTAYGEKVPLPRKIVAGLLLLFFFGFVTAAMYMLVIAMV